MQKDYLELPLTIDSKEYLLTVDDYHYMDLGNVFCEITLKKWEVVDEEGQALLKLPYLEKLVEDAVVEYHYDFDA